MPTPDLLCHVPAVRLDAAQLKQTLTFAFASGVPSTALAQLLESASLPASSWEPHTFTEALFVSELVAGCMRVTIEGHAYAVDRANLQRILGRPPTDGRVVEYRREIMGELASLPELRGEIEKVYVALYQFRTLLETPPMARGLDASRRRLDILGSVKTAIDTMAEAFAASHTGLLRLREFGRQTRAGEAYRRLRDLLDYEENLSTLDVRVRLGIDGRVRALEMLAVKENETNWFYATPLGRFVAKVSSLFRGYRFSEQELLARLIDGVFEGLEDELVQLFQLIGDLEFYLAGLAFRDRAEQRGLGVCLPELIAPERLRAGEAPARILRALFNPLLLAQGVEVVPCDVISERHDMTVIVTGPNSGGKTRLLQSLAITQMLGQCGFFVPAREAVLGVAPGLFVSLIEEATADQTEGRLGMELIRIRSLFEKLRVGSMVVLDELCSGTNPSEGEEIFELVISLLGELAPQAFITTHFLQLAARIAAHPPVPKLAFFQVELDQHQFPTYRFVQGVAQTSLAHRTAARLGVTREELLALIEASKRAHRAREEDEGVTDDRPSPKVSADHKVRASATDAPSK
ncbi:MAG TPA: DNA mismatch repair protein [Polyangiaceae bacterium]|nr:DNA mismatch repair protein [Polyangiaceae bacterium]